jgi:hypothetical protein
MWLSTGEWVTIGIGLANTIIVPGAIFALKAMIDKAADKRVAGVREDLAEHERHDGRRFKEQAEQVEKIEEVRDGQHVQNTSLLSAMQADLKWIKSAILRIPSEP